MDISALAHRLVEERLRHETVDPRVAYDIMEKLSASPSFTDVHFGIGNDKIDIRATYTRTRSLLGIPPDVPKEFGDAVFGEAGLSFDVYHRNDHSWGKFSGVVQGSHPHGILEVLINKE